MNRTCVGLMVNSLFLASCLLIGVTSAEAKRVYALTTENQVLAFNSENPGVLTFSSPVIGALQETEVLKGIDYRPATGILMGVSNMNRAFNLNINNLTGLPVAIASPIGDGFSGVLNGVKVGMDFNPVVDRIRLITDEGSNLRVNPNTGELSGQDSDLAPAGGIVEIAYDRSYPGTQLTTLFGLNSANNSLVRIGGINGVPSPNAGNVVQVGPLGVDFDDDAALDFGGGELLAILKIAGVSTLVALDPDSGAITKNYGAIANNPNIIGMAVAPGFLSAPKMQIKRTFNKPQKDSIKLKALLDIPAGFQVEGTQIHLNIGGVLRSFVLDSKGKAALGQDKIMLKVKSKRGVIEPQQAKLSLKMGGGNYVELEDEGLANTSVKDASVQVFVSLAYGDEIAQQYMPMEYSAKAGKSGKGKN